MTDKPSIPFAETVGLLLKNAGVAADDQLARSLAMAISIKFQETQKERDDAIWKQSHQRGFAEAIEKAVGFLLEEAADPLQSEVWAMAIMEYVAAIRALSPSDDTVRVPRECGKVGNNWDGGYCTVCGALDGNWRAMIAEVK